MKFASLLNQMRLGRIGEEEPAGLYLTSLPWPKEEPIPLSLAQQATTVLPLGKWPGTEIPRRLLMVADGGEAGAPRELAVTQGQTVSMRSKPKASMELLERSPDFENEWQSHFLRLEHGGRSVGLALGLRFEGKVHWWEACRLVVNADTPGCTVIEMCGSIPRRRMTLQELEEQVGYHNTYLHKHNWLTGRIFARVHANGVCEIVAGHINNKFVDEGGDLEDVVPVVGFLPAESEEETSELLGPWDGTRSQFSLGGVAFDVREAARLATPSQPGNFWQEGKWLTWQPYLGVELYGGICPKTLTDDPFFIHPEQQVFSKGMARSLRFSLSLSECSPVVARYLAPSWWYGLCEEFQPAALLPISGPYDQAIDEASEWVQRHIVRGGFEDGSVPRSAGPAGPDIKGRPRWEPGWEGEMPYAQFLTAWRTGKKDDYEAAMRSAYHFTDVAVDHAVKLVRMHGFTPPAVALPMNRVMGTLAAYLETGDPFLYDTARAVITSAHWQHKNSWPRMTVGRDACYMRSAVLFYRYFGTVFFREIAWEVGLTVVESQRENGSFGDQGGGAGVHQWSGYISKPWMGLLAVNGLLDYLELFPDTPEFQKSVRLFADWLMSERGDFEGAKVWFYQHDYNGGRHFTMPYTKEKVVLPGPHPWHHATLARLMAYCAQTFQEPAYLEAWAESFAATHREPNDHSIGSALQFLPWLQARLWNARLTEQGVRIAPYDFGPLTPLTGLIHSPEGLLPSEISDHFGTNSTSRSVTGPNNPEGIFFRSSGR